MTSSQKEESIPTGKSVEAYRRFLNMKNREYRVLVTLALMASLVVGNIAGTSVNVQAADNKDKSTEAKKTSETKTSSSATPAKDETVYVKVDDAGNQKDVTVSDQLKNISSLGTIDDVSDLKDIKNVKGDETFSENNGKLVWQGDKKDICYQGTTTKKIPVGMKVTYEIDGKKVSADDLEGKSGHLKIHYEYQNTSADSGKYIPFLMATGLLMDGEKFSNVTVDNGKVISDGDRNIVIGMGLPQLKEQLTSVSSKVDDLDIPDSFTVEADVTDYEKVEAVTVATNEVFNEVGTDKFDSLDELKDSMTELQDASNKLVDGSEQLKDGLDTLLSSSGTLVSGIDQLASGGNTLAGGTGSLVSGANTLADGSKSLASGTSQLASGAESLNAGAAQVATGAQSASSGANELKAGTAELKAGTDALKQQLDEHLSELTQGVDKLNAGVQKVSPVAKTVSDGLTAMANEKEGLPALAAASNQLAITLEDAAGVKAVDTQQATATATAEVNNDGATADLENLANELETKGETELANRIREIASEVKNSETVTDTQSVTATAELDMTSLAATARSVANGVASANNTVSSLNAVAKGVVDALNKQIVPGVTELQKKVNGSEKVPGLGDTLNAGVAALDAGAGKVDAGMTSLNSGLGTLSAGASQVSEGSAALSTNMKTANAGAQSVASGASQLASGASQLNSGAGTLSTGLNTLQSSTGALVSGVEQLDSGAAELNSGMIQFNEEGIEKLVSVFDGDIDALLDKANELLDASKEYKNFSGIADGMDGSVKFIFVSDK